MTENKRNCAYQRRTGKLSPRQKQLLATSPYLIKDYSQPIDKKIFNNKNPIYCEIGFGKGHFLIEQACKNRSNNYLGIDLYQPGVACILGHIEDKNITNLHIIQQDAYEVLEHMIHEHSIQHIDILHPDPWPKKRHHKRRLISKEFLQLLLSRLVNNGTCRIVSDDSSYTLWIAEIITAMQLPCTRVEDIKAFTKYGNKAEKIQNTITSFTIKAK